MASRHDTYRANQRSLWQENHGNFLLAFAAVVLVAGLAILAYRQWRPIAPTVRHIRADPESTGEAQEDVETSLETSVEPPSAGD